MKRVCSQVNPKLGKPLEDVSLDMSTQRKSSPNFRARTTNSRTSIWFYAGSRDQGFLFKSRKTVLFPYILILKYYLTDTYFLVNSHWEQHLSIESRPEFLEVGTWALSYAVDLPTNDKGLVAAIYADETVIFK